MMSYDKTFPQTRTLWIRVTIPIILSFILFIIAIFGMHVPIIKERLLQQKKSMLKDLTAIIINEIEFHYKMYKKNQISKQFAMEMIIDSIKVIRYGKNKKNYFWINDLDAVMIVHPYREDLNGQDLSSYTDANGNKVFVNFIRLTEQTGEAFTHYTWQKFDDKSQSKEKLSYIKRYKPWGWIIGTGLYIDDLDKEAMAQAWNLLLLTSVILAFILLLSLFSIRQSLIADKQLGTHASLLSGIFNQVNNYIGVINLNGRVEVINKTALDDVSLTNADIYGEFFWETPWWTFSSYSLEKLKHNISEAAHGKHIHFESSSIFSGKTERIMDVSIKPLTDRKGKIIYLLAEANDISEIKKSQQKLEQLNKKLEERVRERTMEIELSLKSLKEAQEKLVEAEKMAALGNLVAGVAHEINTPLGIGITNITFLMDHLNELHEGYKSDDFTKSKLEKFFSIAFEASQSIYTNLARAGKLVKSFKQVAVDHQVEDKQFFNINNYLEELLISLQPLFKHSKHTITIDCPEDIDIESYPGVFAQIITNLINNSLQHGFNTIDPGAIIISIRKEKESVRIEYKDNGTGMTAEQQKKIYDPFYTTKYDDSGTGLGMHIVYNLVVQKLKGVIDLETAPDRGVVFTILIPSNIDE